MNFNTKTENKKLAEMISQAMRKIKAGKENDICRYLPSPKGGYYHHFSMQKMKTEDPEGLMGLIEKHILKPSNPKEVPPRPRAPRGSRKRREYHQLSKPDIDRLLFLARQAGDKEMVRKLTPKKEFKACKKELIAAIKQNRVEEDLWDCYVEQVTNNSQTTSGTPVPPVQPAYSR